MIKKYFLIAFLFMPYLELNAMEKPTLSSEAIFGITATGLAVGCFLYSLLHEGWQPDRPTETDIFLPVGQNDQEDDLIESLERLSERLKALAIKKQIYSCREKLAWLLTMQPIVYLCQYQASLVLKKWATHLNAFGTDDLIDTIVKEANHNVVGLEVESKAWDYNYHEAILKANNQAFLTIKKALKDSDFDLENLDRNRILKAIDRLYQDGSEPKKNIWRAAWLFTRNGIINIIIDNLNEIFEATLETAMSYLPEQLPNNPCDGAENWGLFQEKYFKKLSHKAPIFFAPWLIQIIPFPLVMPAYQPWCVYFIRHNKWPEISVLLAGNKDQKSIIAIIPIDLLKYLLRFTVKIDYPNYLGNI